MVIHVISILILVITLCYMGLIFYMRTGWRKLACFIADDRRGTTTVSILIAARNEEEKLEKTILDILAQDYPASLVELFIVDDNSTDRTSEIILSFAEKGVKLIRLDEKRPLNSYKKKAISEAIQLSNSELIITTDADCRMGPSWLKTIVSFYESGEYKMISSPVAYFEEKNSFEKMQSLEFLFLIGLGASGIGNNMPSTCNGANLAYRRDVFFELKGFHGIDNLASGDDELFLHKVASAYPNGIGFCKSENAIVYTHAKSTLTEFIQQRKRWASKSAHYKNKGIVVLGVFIWLFNIMIILIFLEGLLVPYYLWLGLICLIIKMLAELIFLIPVCSFAGRRNLLWYQPLLSIIHVFYLVFIGIAGNSGKYQWKGRMVR